VVNEDVDFRITFDCPLTSINAFPLPNDFIYYIDPV
jgi:hypothetical protein